MWGGQGWLSLSSTVVPGNEPDNDADVVMIIKCESQLTHGVQSSLVDLSGKGFFFLAYLYILIYMEVYQKGNGKHAIPRRATLNTAHSLYTW